LNPGGLGEDPWYLFGGGDTLCYFQDLNLAHAQMAELHNKFFGLPHMFALVKLLGSRSLPWLVRALLDNLSQKVSSIGHIFMFIFENHVISGGFPRSKTLRLGHLI
jgi:hypothetical protein